MKMQIAMLLSAPSLMANFPLNTWRSALTVITMILAIGAAKLWKRRVIASDIDPVAIAVTRENARGNGVAPWVQGVVADGLTNPLLAASAPYDLIIANILAGPLTWLAPQIVAALAPGGRLVLSGLLRNQEKMILSFYHGLRFVTARHDGPWIALVFEKPPASTSAAGMLK